ncbi:MAG: guanylate kinase [Patescibacteria group bacterium]|nr:guanylate kinase [Patescibacteria group bacterium]
MEEPRILIVGGISGSGKGTICSKLIERHSDSLVRPISVTTRKPRPGERFADHYFFVDKEIFEWLADTDQLLEHTKVWMDHYYGTLKLSVEHSLQQGKSVLFELNTHGIEQITKAMPQAKTVFIQAPSEAEQRIRLELRGTVGTEQDERVIGAKKELDWAQEYKLPIITNDDLGKALEEVESVFF